MLVGTETAQNLPRHVVHGGLPRGTLETFPHHEEGASWDGPSLGKFHDFLMSQHKYPASALIPVAERAWAGAGDTTGGPGGEGGLSLTLSLLVLSPLCLLHAAFSGFFYPLAGGLPSKEPSPCLDTARLSKLLLIRTAVISKGSSEGREAGCSSALTGTQHRVNSELTIGSHLELWSSVPQCVALVCLSHAPVSRAVGGRLAAEQESQTP